MNKKFVIFVGSGGIAHKLSFLHGTFGTLEAVIIYLSVLFLAPEKLQLFCYSFIFLFTFLTLVLGSSYEKYLAQKDPPAFVLDEMAGFFCSIIFLPPSFLYISAAFILFRLFDIWKPLFINKAQKLPGGLGIVVDDLLAGFCANICCQIIRYSL